MGDVVQMTSWVTSHHRNQHSPPIERPPQYASDYTTKTVTCICITPRPLGTGAGAKECQGCGRPIL